MSLAVGTRLGSYEILAQLGAGGMGEVYRARDAKLNRDVALKILPAAFATDRDRLARFQREAQVLASLSHPNIGHIYGFEDGPSASSGQHGATHALVLELIEGPTLADRIAQGPIALSEALPIAKQIADALEAAHEHGIVHRDLKPTNVKVTDDGVVKVLDFGLAKVFDTTTASAAEALNSPTLTVHGTQMGMLLGTAAYMAPEQAKGRAVDRRADIWAFGAVVYEMLSGQRAFTGDDISDTLAAVLRQDIDWTALPAATPASVRRLLARCLDRDPKQRLRDIGEARIVLADPAGGEMRADIAAESVPVLAAPRPLWRRAIPFTLLAVVVAALVATAAWYLNDSTPIAVTRFRFAMPDEQSFTGSARNMVAMSPDGAQMVYVANGRLYLRSLSELDAKAIQGTDGYQAVNQPAFSPDGRSIAFHAVGDQTLKRIGVSGGTAVTICAAADIPLGMSWGPDGIVFGEGSKGIMRVSPNGGTPEVLVRVTEGEVAHGPQVLPGGEYVLFTLATGSAANRWDTAHVVVQSLTSGERKTVIQGGSDARYVPTSHLVYAISGSVFAVPFDLRRLEVTGSPVSMVAGVRRPVGSASGAANFSFSRTGTFVYIPGPVSTSSSQFEVVLTDRKGGIESLNLPPGAYLAPRASPDGARLAFGTDDGKEAIVWIYDLSGTSAMRRLTFGGNNRFPIWTADSTRVAFQSDRDGDLAVFWQPADGMGGAERLTKPDQGTSHLPESWFPKGDAFLFSVTNGSDVSLWVLSLRDRKATPYGAVHSSTTTNAVFSPDGRWVAYASTERGPTRIYVQPFPASGAKYQLPAKAQEVGTQPLWSPDGRELFYNPRPGGFEAVSITTQPTFAFGNPVAVPKPFQTGPPVVRRTFDITPSGKFVGLISAGATKSGTVAAPEIHVVLNWFEELTQRAPAQK